MLSTTLVRNHIDNPYAAKTEMLANGFVIPKESLRRDVPMTLEVITKGNRFKILVIYYEKLKTN